MSVQDTVETQSDRLTGQVKWFNNKAGYGFITVSSGEHKDKDIFTHYSGIRVTNSQYKYLIQESMLSSISPSPLTKATSSSP